MDEVLDDETIKICWRNAVEYRLFMTVKDNLFLPVFKVDGNLVVNPDGSVLWSAREVGYGLHSFLELTTGIGEAQRTIYLPLCMVNPETRSAFIPLLLATVDPRDGRLDSKKAEVCVADENTAIKVDVRLSILAMSFIVLQLFPPDRADRFQLESCPFCKSYTAKTLGKPMYVLMKPEDMEKRILGVFPSVHATFKHVVEECWGTRWVIRKLEAEEKKDGGETIISFDS